ncbi:MAG TPA: DUF1800 domain-containing protein [Candidatus Acidoferrum sp.]|nr:DUF1800 domain-containing protein [Candidatus Acidoferrum sp.]
MNTMPTHPFDGLPATVFFRRVFAALLAVSVAFASPGALGGKQKWKSGSSSGDAQLTKKFKGHLPITELTEDQAILHALNRLAYGPRPGDVERIRQMGLERWVNQQLHPETLDDSELDSRLDERYATLRMSPRELAENFPTAAEVAKREGQEAAEQRRQERRAASAEMAQAIDAPVALARMQGPGRIVADLAMAKLDRALYSQRQLEAVMEDFWFNHFNVFAGKGADRWFLTSYVRDTIRPHTMDKFQDLLIATAKSPAMLFFLDNWLSVDPIAFQQSRQPAALGRSYFQGMFAGGFAPDARSFPAPDGRMPNQRRKQQERGINENYGREVMELHTVGVDAGYTQQDVIEMAKCLTGWTVREPRRDPAYVFKPEFHTAGKKVVMGHTFDYGGERDGLEALKMLANDPHTAKFISAELARHFVSDNPPATLVTRMAANYQETGGDIRSLLRTMIYSPEFWSKQAYRAKVKTPFELVASTARALNADVNVSLPLELWVARMGEPLFLCQPPTGYSDKAATWVNTGALLNRLNFALAIASGKVAGTRVSLQPMFGDGAGTDPDLALQRSFELFLDGQVDPSTRETLEARLGDPQVVQATLDDPVKQVNEGLLAGLVLGTPEFQRR